MPKTTMRLPKRQSIIRVPALKELFAPCPICGGTIDMDNNGIVYCHSCGQMWTIIGKPYREDAWLDIINNL